MLTACVVALASAMAGAWAGIPKLDDWRKDYYGTLPASLRDDPVALLLGFDVASWERSSAKSERATGISSSRGVSSASR